MFAYYKFFKGNLMNKRKLENHETIALTEECNAFIHNKSPLKLKGSSSFLILYLIKGFNFDTVFCDLGASVNFMPLSIC